MGFQTDLEKLISKYELEDDSETSSALLASFMRKSMAAFNETVISREESLKVIPQSVDITNPKKDDAK